MGNLAIPLKAHPGREPEQGLQQTGGQPSSSSSGGAQPGSSKPEHSGKPDEQQSGKPCEDPEFQHDMRPPSEIHLGSTSEEGDYSDYENKEIWKGRIDDGKQPGSSNSEQSGNPDEQLGEGASSSQSGEQPLGPVVCGIDDGEQPGSSNPEQSGKPDEQLGEWASSSQSAEHPSGPVLWVQRSVRKDGRTRVSRVRQKGKSKGSKNDCNCYCCLSEGPCCCPPNAIKIHRFLKIK